jgi:outer membrane protein TolC
LVSPARATKARSTALQIRSSDGDVPRQTILRAEFDSQKTLHENKRVVASEVYQTEEAYWNLAQATRSYAVVHASLESAKEQFQLTQRQIEAGILAPADLINDESNVAQRELDLMQAEAGLQGAMDGLRSTLNLPKEEWSTPLLATDMPQVDQEPIDAEEAMQDALNYRAEMRVHEIDEQLSELDRRLAGNNRLPDLNVGFGYGLAGQSARYRNTIDEIRDLGARDWSVFVNLSWTPLGRETSANQEIVEASARVRKVQHQQFLAQLRTEIRNALRDVEASRREVAASEKFRSLAERSLEVERNRFLNGKSRNVDVTLREDSLASARMREISARIQYLKASGRLHLATGKLLDKKNIKLSVK